MNRLRTNDCINLSIGGVAVTLGLPISEWPSSGFDSRPMHLTFRMLVVFQMKRYICNLAVTKTPDFLSSCYHARVRICGLAGTLPFLSAKKHAPKFRSVTDKCLCYISSRRPISGVTTYNNNLHCNERNNDQFHGVCR